MAITLPARMLAVIDVSGSMLDAGADRRRRDPRAGHGGGGPAGLASSTTRGRSGCGSFSTCWTATRTTGSWCRSARCPTQRDQCAAALAAIRPKPNGDTGLYDTILAAYKTVQDGLGSGPGQLGRR